MQRSTFSILSLLSNKDQNWTRNIWGKQMLHTAIDTASLILSKNGGNECYQNICIFYHVSNSGDKIKPYILCKYQVWEKSRGWNFHTGVSINEYKVIDSSGIADYSQTLAMIDSIHIRIISYSQVVSILSKINGDRKYFCRSWASEDSFLVTCKIGHPTLALLSLLQLIQTSENPLTILLPTKWSQRFQMGLIRLLIKPPRAKRSFHLRQVPAFELIKPLYSSIPD